MTRPIPPTPSLLTLHDPFMAAKAVVDHIALVYVLHQPGGADQGSRRLADSRATLRRNGIYWPIGPLTKREAEWIIVDTLAGRRPRRKAS